MEQIESIFFFNSDKIKVQFDFHGDQVHVQINSTALGVIEDSTGPAADYAHIWTRDEILSYVMEKLAFHAYLLADKLEEERLWNKK